MLVYKKLFVALYIRYLSLNNCINHKLLFNSFTLHVIGNLIDTRQLPQTNICMQLDTG